MADGSTCSTVLEAVRSGRWAVSGPYRGAESFECRFRRAFSEYCRVPHCILTANGSSALVTALESLGIGPGDGVLVPGLTWVACATAPLRVGAYPVFIDLRSDGLTMCPDAAEDRLRLGDIKAIILVHQFCEVADLSRFRMLADTYGAVLIEDCSQAHGAKWNGVPVGTVGDVGIFSMQQTKLLTCGEGGAIITHNAKLGHRMAQFRADGRLTVEEPHLGQLELAEVDGIQGYNFCLSELHAALLLDGLRKLDDQNLTRKRFASALNDRLNGVPGVMLPGQGAGDAAPSYYRYCFMIEEDRLRGRPACLVAEAIGREISAQVLAAPVPLPRHTLFRPWNAPRQRGAGWDNWARPFLPHAERVHRTAICIPHEYLLAPDEWAVDIAAAVAKVLDNVSELP
jgi:L-glutamine:scyllo-inosose aminotransferase/L-glutamine:2-deoxy-scyllo-inosose/3-amino-2,3-dideoxy-scyllo-inosose aminotransferase